MVDQLLEERMKAEGGNCERTERQESTHSGGMEGEGKKKRKRESRVVIPIANAV